MMKNGLKEKQSIVFRIAIAALLVWVIVSLFQLQIEIQDKRVVLDELQAQIIDQQRINDELETKNADDAAYLEQQARNKGLAKPGEIIYKEIPGN